MNRPVLAQARNSAAAGRVGGLDVPRRGCSLTAVAQARSLGQAPNRKSTSQRLMRIVLAGLLAIAFTAGAAQAATETGVTSQHRPVSVTITHKKLTGLIITLRATCTNHTHLEFTPGFEAPFAHPQSASGRVADSYNILGRDVATDARFRQQARFTATIRGTQLTATAQATQTLLATGVVCRSPTVSFRLHV